MTGGFDVDPETLRAYAAGPLAEARARLQDASRTLAGAQADSGAFPPPAQVASSAQARATTAAQETLTEAARAVDALTARVLHTVEAYSGAEDVNTRNAGGGR